MAYWRLRHTHLTWSGVEQAQSQGPVFVLANHSNILDPAMLVAAFARPIHFLAADTAMQEPFEGRVSRFFGAIPKRKFALDMAAIRTIRQWAKLGASIGLFPEGERSWNNAPLPFVPGIERLIRMVKLPIVTARILNAGRIWPRWAPRPRKGQVHIEFSPPKHFSKQDSDASILAWIKESLAITPEQLEGYRVQGQALARGLPNALFACPACGAFDQLQAHEDELDCPSCNQRWRVDSKLRLQSPTHEPMDLDTAMQRAQHRLQACDGQIRPGQSIQLESAGVTVRERHQSGRRDAVQGVLRLARERLELTGPRPLSIELSQIDTCSLDLRRKLLVRLREQSYEFHIPTASALLWESLIRHYLGQERPDANALQNSR